MDKSKLEYAEFYKAELGSGNYCTKSFGFAVWRHQQVKVDELQKRVDAVIIEIEKLHLSGVIGWGAVKRLEQALKGSDE